MGFFSSIGHAVKDLSGAVNNLTNAISSLTDIAQKLMSFTPMGMAMELGSLLLKEFASQLPSDLKQIVMQTFENEIGNYHPQFENVSELLKGFSDAGASPLDVGALSRDSQSLRDTFSNMYATETSDGGDGKSWLLALAKAMAKDINAKKDEVVKLQKQVTGNDAGKSAEFQAASQELNLLMTTATNTIKTLGEGMSALARK